MKEINYIVWKEDSYYVSQCLNVEVSSFGLSVEEAIKNLFEAVELYFDGEKVDFKSIDEILIGSKQLAIANQ